MACGQAFFITTQTTSLSFQDLIMNRIVRSIIFHLPSLDIFQQHRPEIQNHPARYIAGIFSNHYSNFANNFRSYRIKCNRVTLLFKILNQSAAAVNLPRRQRAPCPCGKVLPH